MAQPPRPGSFRPDSAFAGLGADFADPVSAAEFPQHRLRFRNDRWAAAVGLADLTDEAWVDHFGRFQPLAGAQAEPLALRYHGHQFRVYNPDIGDGRGFLFAQLRDGNGRLLDLGTKGSGTTPYSRFGDGRLTLKGGVREVLATEMLEALGVETSKSFSLIETGEALHRGDEPSPTRSAVLVRLSHGHVRIGSFQRLATIGDLDNMGKLARYVLEELYGEAPGDEPELRLLERVVARTAVLAASYMAAGFVHGVLNTDNINVMGESFDYGPWRFTPSWDPAFTAAYFDHSGLYAFGRQPQAIYWDVVQLALAFSRRVANEALAERLDRFPAYYETAYRAALLGRLGVTADAEQRDLALVAALEEALLQGGVEIDRLFFDWRGGGLRRPTHRYDAAPFDDLRERLVDRVSATPSAHPYWQDDAPCSLHIDEVEAIWSSIADNDDWTAFDAKVAAIRRLGEAHGG